MLLDNRKQKIRPLMIIAYMSMAIVSSQGSVLSFDIAIPSIILFVGILFVDFILQAYKTTVKIHPVIYLLVLRYLLFTVNYFAMGLSNDLWTEDSALTLICIISVLYFSNFSDSALANVKWVVISFSLFTSIQTILNIALSGFNLDKNFIVAGVGHSNYIATILVVCIGYLAFIRLTKLTIITIIVDTFALIATQSMGGYIAFFCLFILFVCKRINFKRSKNVLLFILFCIAGIAGMSVFLASTPGKPILEMILRKLELLKDGDLMRFGSSRFALYEFSWNNIKKHLFLGSIENYNYSLPADYGWQNFKTHNFILESLLLFGILGSVINLMIFIIMIKSLRKSRLEKCIKEALAIVIVLTLVHGFIEPNLFTLRFDAFFGMFIGSMLFKQGKYGTKDNS